MKKSVAALLASAALVALALPALAAPPPDPDPEPAPPPVVVPEQEPATGFDAGYVAYQLNARGVNVVSVEEWGAYLRAFVRGADGRETMQLFDPDTLNPVSF